MIGSTSFVVIDRATCVEENAVSLNCRNEFKCDIDKPCKSACMRMNIPAVV